MRENEVQVDSGGKISQKQLWIRCGSHKGGGERGRERENGSRVSD